MLYSSLAKQNKSKTHSRIEAWVEQDALTRVTTTKKNSKKEKEASHIDALVKVKRTRKTGIQLQVTPLNQEKIENYGTKSLKYPTRQRHK